MKKHWPESDTPFEKNIARIIDQSLSTLDDGADNSHVYLESSSYYLVGTRGCLSIMAVKNYQLFVNI